MDTYKPRTLGEKILNIIREVNPDEALEDYVINTSANLALAAFLADKDKLIDFAISLNIVGATKTNFPYVTLSKALRDKETTANPRGFLLNTPHWIAHTHEINGYYFVKLGDFKPVNLQKITITL
jgi:hypothetical protein